MIHVAHLATCTAQRLPSLFALLDAYHQPEPTDTADTMRSTLVAMGRLDPVSLDRLRTAAATSGVALEFVAWHWKWDPTLLWRLASRLRRSRIDLVHAHDTCGWVMALLLQPWLGYRMVASAPPAADDLEQVPRSIWHSLLTGFDRVIAHNQRLALELCQNGCRTSQVEVIPASVDTQRFSRRAVSSDFRFQWGLDRRARIVGIPASALSEDELRAALGAARAAQSMLGPMHVIVFGDTVIEPQWARIAEQCGVRPRTHMIAGADHRPEIYAALDVLLVPAGDDGPADRVLLESQSMEVPLVCVARPGINDLVEPGCTAIVVPQSDPQLLGAAVVQLLSDARQGQALAQAARLRICQRYDQKDHIRAMVRTYRHVIAQR